VLIDNPFVIAGNWFQGLHQVYAGEKFLQIGAGKSFMNQATGVRLVLKNSVAGYWLHR